MFEQKVDSKSIYIKQRDLREREGGRVERATEKRKIKKRRE